MAGQDEMDDDAMGYAADHPAVLASIEAMSFGQKSWEAGRDECLAWARVKASADPGALSNTGHKGVCWQFSPGEGGVYRVSIWDGETEKVRLATVSAPDTLEEARSGPLLERAVARRDAHPAPPERARAHGMGPLILSVLETTAEGRDWLSRSNVRNVLNMIVVKASTGEAFGSDGWSRNAGITTHQILRAQPDRVELVASGITTADARALAARRAEEKRMRLRVVTPPRSTRRPYIMVDALPASTSKGLHAALKAGVTFEQIEHAWSTLLEAAVQGDERVAA